MDTTQKLFEIHFKNGEKVKLAGKNITEAFAQTGKRTPDGNIDFSILDFYVRIPHPIESVKKFQLFLMKDKKSEWKFVSDEFTNLEFAESIMLEKVKREGYFSGLVTDENEVPMSWKFAS